MQRHALGRQRDDALPKRQRSAFRLARQQDARLSREARDITGDVARDMEAIRRERRRPFVTEDLKIEPTGRRERLRHPAFRGWAPTHDAQHGGVVVMHHRAHKERD